MTSRATSSLGVSVPNCCSLSLLTSSILDGIFFVFDIAQIEFGTRIGYLFGVGGLFYQDRRHHLGLLIFNLEAINI
jgi:hypothetical protein